MSTLIYWFRNDLRLSDNPAFESACAQASHLMPVYCHAPEQDQPTRWGFERQGHHRRAFLGSALDDLNAQLVACGSALIELTGTPVAVLTALAKAIGADRICCEAIAAPEEEDEIAALRAAGLTVVPRWQSSLLEPSDLPFAISDLPKIFTPFRLSVEKAGVVPPIPRPAPSVLPPLPALPQDVPLTKRTEPFDTLTPDSRSSFPFHLPEFKGGETAGLAHLERYCDRRLPLSYKATRNGLLGIDYSSKFSPWLAHGAISARTIYRAIKDFEAVHGANEGTYWLWFELLWRDYFRFLHLKHGRALYRARGLAAHNTVRHDPEAFARWCHGETGEPFVDAGMRELAATGYLSNRLRQNVASYLVHTLGCDWRAGAAWFEARLVDFDICSNQGNWLSIAGLTENGKGARAFSPVKQASDYDPDGHYRAVWAAP